MQEQKRTMKADVVIVGAGIVGSAIARHLSSYKLDVVLLEKENDVLMGTSKANNAHIVCGADCTPGKIETEIVANSNKAYDKVTEELQVPYKRIGTYYVAIKDDELEKLEIMRQGSIDNGVTDVKIVGRDEILKAEPHITKEARAALHVPKDGIVSPYNLGIALCENAVQNGVKIITNTQVKDIIVEDGAVKKVICDSLEIVTKAVINSAGLFSDEVSAMSGWDNFKLHPRRGEFYILDRKYSYLANHIVYPLPNPISRGSTISPTIDGPMLVGPTAVDMEDKFDKSTTREGLEEVINGVKRYFPEIRASMAITQYAGLRAAGEDDLIIGKHETVRGFINAAAIRSTGISACLGIAERVAELLGTEMDLVADSSYNPCRKRVKPFSECSKEEQDEMIKKDPAYGRVVCRCETVTEKEILDVIHNVLPARDLDAIKRRVRAGMGRCQGGFCSSRIVTILSRELGVPMEQVSKRGPGTEILKRPTKQVI